MEIEELRKLMEEKNISEEKALEFFGNLDSFATENFGPRQNYKREIDAIRFRILNEDGCQLCNAKGQNMRNLFLECLYDLNEYIPELIDTDMVRNTMYRGTYYLRICKSCRARFLNHLKEWREECVALRACKKDSDGYLSEEGEE